MDPDTLVKIKKILKRYPNIEKILPEPSTGTKLVVDQYGGEIPSYRFEEIAQSTIYGVLLAEDTPQFLRQLRLLNDLLAHHKIFQNDKFGGQLASGFFSHLSEIEIYNALVQKGFDPITESPIPNKNTKKADFEIKWNGNRFLIEVTTPRMPLDQEEMFRDPMSQNGVCCGFYDPKLGLLDPGPDGFYPLERKIIEKYGKFEPEGPDFNIPTVIVINLTYAHFGASDIRGIYKKKRFYDFLHGILSYQADFHSPEIRYRCRFFENPCICVPEKESQFFNTLLC